MVTVNAVRWASVLTATMRGRSSWSARSLVIGAQISPDVCLTKNAMVSGVANSAAMMRSPSFSRSSSSTTMTISPRPIAAMAFSIDASGIVPSAPFSIGHRTGTLAGRALGVVVLFDPIRRRDAVAETAGMAPRFASSGVPLSRADCHEPFDVLGEKVHLEIDVIADASPAQGCHLARVGDDGDREAVTGGLDHREAAPVDGDRSLLHDVTGQPAGKAHRELRRGRKDL